MNILCFSATRWLVTGVILSFLFSPAIAQNLEHVAQVYSVGGDVQFLPGGYVIKSEDGQAERYLYRNGKFERFQAAIPPLLENWTSFDWVQADYLDEIDRKSFDPAFRALLPTQSKLKKVLEIELPENRGTLALICYTRRSKEKLARPDATDIFVTGAISTEPSNRLPHYRKSWDLKVKPDSDYGDFQYQVLPGGERLILLYTAAKGGNSVDRDLEIFRIGKADQPGSSRLKPRTDSVRGECREKEWGQARPRWDLSFTYDPWGNYL
jgi:hypothetical protein